MSDLDEKIVFENFAGLHDTDDGSLKVEFSIFVNRRLSLLRFLKKRKVIRKRRELVKITGYKA